MFDLFLLSRKDLKKKRSLGKTTLDVTTVGIFAYVDVLKLSIVFGNKQISLFAFSVISGFALLFTQLPAGEFPTPPPSLSIWANPPSFVTRMIAAQLPRRPSWQALHRLPVLRPLICSSVFPSQPWVWKVRMKWQWPSLKTAWGVWLGGGPWLHFGRTCCPKAAPCTVTPSSPSLCGNGRCRRESWLLSRSRQKGKEEPCTDRLRSKSFKVFYKCK